MFGNFSEFWNFLIGLTFFRTFGNNSKWIQKCVQAFGKFLKLIWKCFCVINNHCTKLFESNLNFLLDSYIKWHIRITNIFKIFCNAIFKPGSFIRHDLNVVVVVVVDGIFVGVERR